MHAHFTHTPLYQITQVLTAILNFLRSITACYNLICSCVTCCVKSCATLKKMPRSIPIYMPLLLLLISTDVYVSRDFFLFLKHRKHKTAMTTHDGIVNTLNRGTIYGKLRQHYVYRNHSTSPLSPLFFF